MAPALSIHLFLIFIPLSHGRLNTSLSLTNNMISVPSVYNVSFAVPSPSPSSKWTPALTNSTSRTYASSKAVPSSKQITAPHLKYSASVTTIPTSSLVMRNLNSSTVTLNPSPIPATVNLTNSSSRTKLNSMISSAILSQTSSIVERNSPTFSIRNSTVLSSKEMRNSTSSPVMMNQTSPTTPAVLSTTSSTSKTSANLTSVLVNVSSSEAKPNLTSSSEVKLNLTSSSKVKPNFTATSVIFNITSTGVIKSMMPSVILTSQSTNERSTVFPSYFTAAIEASCNTNNNLRTCIKLQPSPSRHYKPTSRGINITTSVGQSGTMFINVSSMASGSNASSVHKPTPSPGPQDEEETHTTLIVGLAVGLSLGMVLFIIIIVYYRRRRASYQYNVFYDEQNIVMHPFDYSK